MSLHSVFFSDVLETIDDKQFAQVDPVVLAEKQNEEFEDQDESLSFYEYASVASNPSPEADESEIKPPAPVFKVESVSKPVQQRIMPKTKKITKAERVPRQLQNGRKIGIKYKAVMDTNSLKCKKCGMYFKKSVQLGGHLSKAHPGKSESYNKKMAIRKANEQDREFLKQAKEWFTANTGILDLKTYRDRITKIKNILKDGKAPKVIDFSRVKIGEESLVE